MRNKEWLGNEKLVRELLKSAGLYYVEKSGILKETMKWIIWYKYVDLLTINESLAKLSEEHGIDICPRTYSRILNKAIDLIEKNKVSNQEARDL